MTERFETFTVLINRISRNIRKIKNNEMREYDLRSAHISCLYYAYTTQGINFSEFCEKCEEDKATVSRTLDYLKREDYITETGNEKKYKNPIVLTEKGREAGKRIADKINAVLDEISACLTEEERRAFYKSLAAISDSLDAVARRNEEKA